MLMIKIGVVGAGHLGRWHINNLKALENVELVGFFDTDRRRSAVIAEEYGALPFDSLEALLEKCQAVSIVVPTRSHYQVARAALQRGLHVFCEKPFMQTLEEADEIIELAQQKGLVLQVGHIERFNPALSGIGDFPIKPLFIESHRISPFNPRGTDVAVILDLMIHDIDIVLAMVSSEIEQIDASGAPVLTDTIDIANARLKFANGCVANITASRISDKQMRKIRIFQKDAYLSIDFLKNRTSIYSLSQTPGEPLSGTVPIAELKINDQQTRFITYQEIHTTESNAMLEELRAFTRTITTGAPPPVTGADGKRALEIALQIEHQIQTSLKKVL
ncbi:MAG TPA: Gfo/Idh/MocA family oxidoreductase [Candidatus Marinimicrobia bacterium]|nr:Gfo/Idh/MocA family oxidoreductase [Candidatus Neomarinimicrobiota bacterium]